LQKRKIHIEKRNIWNTSTLLNLVILRLRRALRQLCQYSKGIPISLSSRTRFLYTEKGKFLVQDLNNFTL
jgi:hypothetical protein